MRDSMERDTMDTSGAGTGLPSASGNVSSLWDVEEKYWQENYRTRPYAIGDTEFYEQRFKPAYRYGFESAHHHMGRAWEDAESDLRSGWDKYEHRPTGKAPSAWDDVKEAVRDAWDRVRGKQSPGLIDLRQDQAR